MTKTHDLHGTGRWTPVRRRRRGLKAHRLSKHPPMMAGRVGEVTGCTRTTIPLGLGTSSQPDCPSQRRSNSNLILNDDNSYHLAGTRVQMALSAQWMLQAAAASTRGPGLQQQHQQRRGGVVSPLDMATARLREQAVALIRDAKRQEEEIAKVACLRQALSVVLQGVPELLPELLQHVLDAQTGPGWRARAYLAEVVELVGFKFLKQVPAMLPALQVLLQDSAPAVVMKAIVAAVHLYGFAFEQLLLQGIYSGQVEKWLTDVWAKLGKVKEAVFPALVDHSNDIVRLHAVKFVETTVLLFSPDPSSSQPEGEPKQCNVAWIEAGHPVLAAEELGQEAVRNLELLLDHLRAPAVGTLTSSLAIVLLNSLGNIAKRRPSLFGRIAPALIALAPNCEGVQVVLIKSVEHTLRNNLMGLLKCSHSAATPWREKVLAALREMDAGDMAESALRQMNRLQRNAEKDRMAQEKDKVAQEKDRVAQDRRTKDGRFQASSAAARFLLSPGKRPVTQENGNKHEASEDFLRRTRLDLSDDFSSEPSRPLQPEVPVQETRAQAVEVESTRAPELPPSHLSPEQQLINLIAAMLALPGEQGRESVKLVLESLMPDQLADIFMANMDNLQDTPPPIDAPVRGDGPDSAGTAVVENRSDAVTSPGVEAQPSEDVPPDSEQMTEPPSVEVTSAGEQVSEKGTSAPSVDGTGSEAPETAGENVPVDSGMSASRDTPNAGVPEASSNNESEAAHGGTIEATTVSTDTTRDVRASPVVLPRAKFVPMRLEKEPGGTVSGQAATEEVGVASSGLTEAHVPTPSASPPLQPLPAAEPLSNLGELERASTALASSLDNEAQPGSSSVPSESTAPILVLADEQQARHCKTSVEHIRESYKTIPSGGGGELRVGLPAR